MRTLCSAVFGLASSVVGSCVLGEGGEDWGVVGEPIRGGEEGCSGELNAIKLPDKGRFRTPGSQLRL